jgi:hypothetical protein
MSIIFKPQKLIQCKVREWGGKVIYIGILSIQTGLYTVCQVSNKNDVFTGYQLVPADTFTYTTDTVEGYLYSKVSAPLVPSAILFKNPTWRIYIPHLRLSSDFPNEPTEKNVEAFLEGLNAC